MTISFFNLQYCHYYWFLTLLLSWLCFCFFANKKEVQILHLVLGGGYSNFWVCDAIIYFKSIVYSLKNIIISELKKILTAEYEFYNKNFLIFFNSRTYESIELSKQHADDVNAF